MESLWEAIFCAVRIQDGDAVQAWREHDALLSEKCEILNKYQFTELHYENEAGTDFRVGLVKNHIWEGGSEESGSGVRFYCKYADRRSIYNAGLQKSRRKGRKLPAAELSGESDQRLQSDVP